MCLLVFEMSGMVVVAFVFIPFSCVFRGPSFPMRYSASVFPLMFPASLITRRCFCCGIHLRVPKIAFLSFSPFLVEYTQVHSEKAMEIYRKGYYSHHRCAERLLMSSQKREKAFDLNELMDCTTQRVVSFAKKRDHDRVFSGP